MQGDSLADSCYQEMGSVPKIYQFLECLHTNRDVLPSDTPSVLKSFVEQTTTIPRIDEKPVDQNRIQRGQKVFMTHALPSALVLLTKSLPEGYAAPNLSKILALTGNLQRDPYQRLLGVLQMLVNVTSAGGFEPEGAALITIPKIRLLHAGVRHIVRKNLPGYEGEYGPPVNLEDMLGTLMGFSYLVIRGLQKLDIELSRQEMEDMYYLWRVFGQMMGMHPPDQPDSSAYIPATIPEAEMFYQAYARRHYRESKDNPDGVELAAANLHMLQELLPQTPLRRLGLNIVPRIYMNQLMGKEACSRVGMKPVRFFYLTKFFLHQAPGLWTRLWDVMDLFDPAGRLHENLSRMFFQAIIRIGAHGEIVWVIPKTREELLLMVQKRKEEKKEKKK